MGDIGVAAGLVAQLLFAPAAPVPGVRLLGVDLYRNVEILFGVAEILFVPIGGAAVEIGVGIAGLQRDGMGVVRESEIVLAEMPPGDAAIDIGFGVVRLQPDRLRVILFGAVVLILFLERQAAIDIGVFVVGLEAERGVEIGDGAVVVAFVLIGETAIDQRGLVPRIELQRLGIVGDRLVVLAFVVIGVAAVVKGDGQVHRGFLARLDDGGAAADAQIGIVAFAPIPLLIAGLRADRTGRDERGQRRAGNKALPPHDRPPGHQERERTLALSSRAHPYRHRPSRNHGGNPGMIPAGGFGGGAAPYAAKPARR
ncbi:MAG TPA: hypothetical protein VGR52_11930 [Stellaceae bacterium]|nr:hypothetical protein [Stellaceae bacterium]